MSSLTTKRIYKKEKINMKKTLLLLAMIASTASFAGNMVKLSADSSRDFSNEKPTVPTVFAAEVSMDKVAGTGLSFGGRLADSTKLYNLELTQNTVLDGKANFWAQYEAEVKGVKGLAKFSVDLDRKDQGFGLFYDDNDKAKQIKSTDDNLSEELAKGDALYAANEGYATDKLDKVTDYMGYKDVKDGKYKKAAPEKKGTIETSLSKEFMINDSKSLIGSFNTKSTFEFAKESKPETVFTLGLDSKLNDGKLGLALETANNYKAPNGGFEYVSGKLSGGYSAFDAEAFIKYNFGRFATALNNKDNGTTGARTDKLNKLLVEDKLDELTKNKKITDEDSYVAKYGNTYAKDKTYGDVYDKTLEKRIKDASKELKLYDKPFLEDYVQAHAKYEKSGFAVEGKLKFSNASSDVVKYKLNSGKDAIELNMDESHKMQEYMPELMLNLGYKASNGMSVSLNNDLTYKATVKTGYTEKQNKENENILDLAKESSTDHNLRYAVELKSEYTKDFASFAFETSNSVSAILNADLHDAPKKDATEGSGAETNGQPGESAEQPAEAVTPVASNGEASENNKKPEKEFGITTAVINLNSLVSLTAKVTDKVSVTPSLNTTISTLLGKKSDKGVRGVATPKVALQYMPLSGLTLGSYVSSDINAEFDMAKGSFEQGISTNYKQPTVKFGGSLQYNW